MKESDIKRGFLLAKSVSHQSGYQIDKEANWAAMTGMLDLRQVPQWIINGFNNRAFRYSMSPIN
ncbi:hypothetical protein AAW31_01210 [Nitrosomonas communis]|uniref:Uncharacterized protein n=1 Tax=Nitrosomonas communis TaxID=44574 RepID=A0A0F7KAX4_9PROT|nr:hypothetical protein AAW31_01210 [Nitrosomonas communis]